MKKTTLIISFTFVCFNLFSQSKFHIGFNYLFCKDYLNNVSFASIYTSFDLDTENQNAYGLNLGYQINKNLELETGFLKKDFKWSYNNIYSLQINNSINTYPMLFEDVYIQSFIIPIRLNFSHQLKESNFYIISSLGIALNYTLDKNFGINQYNMKIAEGTEDEIIFYYEYNHNLNKKNQLLLESGLGMKYVFANKLSLSTKVFYFFGISQISSLDLRWVSTENNDYVAFNRTIHKSTFYGLDISLKYLF